MLNFTSERDKSTSGHTFVYVNIHLEEGARSGAVRIETLWLAQHEAFTAFGFYAL